MQAYGVAATQSGTWAVSPLAATTGGYSYLNISAAATTTVKSGAGTLHSIIINTPVASGEVVLYDSTSSSGMKIATITSPSTLLSQGPLTALYDVAFSTGLTVVTTGAQDISVAFK
jgi:hypothetical protein